MKGLWFEKKPGPVHLNCKCEIEEFRAIWVTGLADAIIVPPGVDLAANIAEARRVAKECEATAQETVAPFADDYRAKEAEKLFALLYKCEWIIEKFQSGADYDYKAVNGKHPEYTDFGNYHYGLYTNAMGVDATFAQVGAGYYQLKKKTSEWWNPKWIINYFDDPRDNRRIREGQQYPLD